MDFQGYCEQKEENITPCREQTYSVLWEGIRHVSDEEVMVRIGRDGRGFLQ